MALVGKAAKAEREGDEDGRVVSSSVSSYKAVSILSHLTAAWNMEPQPVAK